MIDSKAPVVAQHNKLFHYQDTFPAISVTLFHSIYDTMGMNSRRLIQMNFLQKHPQSLPFRLHQDHTFDKHNLHTFIIVTL